jgi:mannosyltransferase
MINYLFTHTPLYFFIQSFWRDEAFTVILSKQPLINLLVTTAKDFNPPLYYLLVHFWMNFFGSSEISIRTISLIFYWLTIYFCFLFLTNILKFSVKKSFIYLLFFVVNPILFMYACEARMYTMLAFFTTASFYYFFQKEKKNYIIFTTLGLFTHYFMILVLVIQSTNILINKYLCHCEEPRFHRGKLRDEAISFNIKHIIIPIVIFIPWGLFVLTQKNFSTTSFWIEKTSLKSLINLPAYLFTGYENTNKFFGEEITKLAYLLWAIIISGIFVYFKKPKDKILLRTLAIWGLVVPFILVVISFVKPVFLVRYLIFSSVGLLLLLVYIWDNLIIYIKLLAIVLVIFILFNFQKLELKDNKKSDYRDIMTEIKRLAKPDDVMYVTSELDYFTAQYYFYPDRVYIYGKTYEEIPDYTGKVLIPKSRIVNSLPLYPKKAFIYTSDSTYEIQSAF